MTVDLVIFDCDGVLVDSEVITNRIFADMLNSLGANLTLDDMFVRFVGLPMSVCLDVARDLIGREHPPEFLAEYLDRTQRALMDELQPVPGIHSALARLTTPVSVVSSGDHQKMAMTLGLTGLLERFEGRRFSVTQVSRGKPAPDVFLFAAAQMGVPPHRTIVVEDTPVGVRAGKAAGMTTFGYAGRTPAERLLDAGASTVFASMHMLPELLGAAQGSAAL